MFTKKIIKIESAILNTQGYSKIIEIEAKQKNVKNILRDYARKNILLIDFNEKYQKLLNIDKEQ